MGWRREEDIFFSLSFFLPEPGYLAGDIPRSSLCQSKHFGASPGPLLCYYLYSFPMLFNGMDRILFPLLSLLESKEEKKTRNWSSTWPIRTRNVYTFICRYSRSLYLLISARLLGINSDEGFPSVSKILFPTILSCGNTTIQEVNPGSSLLPRYSREKG